MSTRKTSKLKCDSKYSGKCLCRKIQPSEITFRLQDFKIATVNILENVYEEKYNLQLHFVEFEKF